MESSGMCSSEGALRPCNDFTAHGPRAGATLSCLLSHGPFRGCPSSTGAGAVAPDPIPMPEKATLCRRQVSPAAGMRLRAIDKGDPASGTF